MGESLALSNLNPLFEFKPLFWERAERGNYFVNKFRLPLARGERSVRA